MSQGQGAGCRQEWVGQGAEPSCWASAVGTGLHVLPELREGPRGGLLPAVSPEACSQLPFRMCGN